ncbi:MAG TPA: RidA family protein [Vicinamibacteria bacterium]|nr:RidA family protein [Vicinamibacteria bacterium]
MRFTTLLLALFASGAGAQTIERINPEGMTQPTAYHHLVRAGNLLFIAGQVALDGEGTLVGAADMRAQVRQVLENLKTVLASQNADFSNIVKINIFTTDIDAFREAADVRATYFQGNPPASTLVQIERLAQPEFLVEIEAIAVVGE